MPAEKMLPKKEEIKYENLSEQAKTFLRKRGYSTRFITNLMIMLRDAGSVHRRTVYEGPKQSEQEFMWSPMIPTPPIQAKMPKKLDWQYIETTYGGKKILMPDIGPYAPNTTTTPGVYKAFASPEGQKFMKKYYVNGWLKKDPKTGEWMLKPPAKTVPRKVAVK